MSRLPYVTEISTLSALRYFVTEELASEGKQERPLGRKDCLGTALFRLR